MKASEIGTCYFTYWRTLSGLSWSYYDRPDLGSYELDASWLPRCCYYTASKLEGRKPIQVTPLLFQITEGQEKGADDMSVRSFTAAWGMVDIALST